jgi:peptidase E
MKEEIMYLHSINTFACHDNEVYIRAVNNRGVDTLLVIPADEVLEWVDISYVREQVIKHYRNINKEDVIDEVRQQIIDTYKTQEEAENLKSRQNK